MMTVVLLSAPLLCRQRVSLAYVPTLMLTPVTRAEASVSSKDDVASMKSGMLEVPSSVDGMTR